MSDAEDEDAPRDEAPAEAEEPELPGDVPDDWLDQKPFDPAGR
jgi:hypothetical protein